DASKQDKSGHTALSTFTSVRQPPPTVEEQTAFEHLLTKMTALQSKETAPMHEEVESSDVDKFFSAAASLEASVSNSIENSADEGKSRPAKPKAGKATKLNPWIGHWKRAMEKISR